MPARANDSRLTYLNGVLTANAILLAALAWTQLVGVPTGTMANAAPQSTPVDTFPNASVQRERIANEIKSLRSDLGRIESLLAGGKTRVVLANPGDIKLEIDYVKLKQVMKD